MQRIDQDIKNQSYLPCYLLYGKEVYLLLQYRDKLKHALVAEDDNMNYNYYVGKDVNINAVIDQAETMPFFADRRVIILENLDLLKDEAEKLADYISGQSETTVIIMVCESIDKRSKVYKAFEKNGRAIEFTEQTPETLTRWILGRMKKENKQIQNSAMEAFLARVGTDMSVINIEMEKLCSYTYGRNEITVKDIEEIVTVSTSAKVFDMIKAMANRKQKIALDMYHDLLAHKESPFGILALIVMQFNKMLTVKEMLDDGLDVKRIAQRMNLWDKYVREYKAQADKYTFKQLRAALDACGQADEDAKLGRLTPELAVELLIIEYSKS